MSRPAIHPGEVLADELSELNLSAAEFGRRVKVPANRISQILRGQRSISADTAIRFGYFLGTGPELWMNLQRAYDLRLAETTLGKQIRSAITPLDQSG
jgi:addiction module HigA family antidote